jgi:hypothetical protein
MIHTPGPWEAHFVVGAGWEVRTQHVRPGRECRDPVCAMSWFQFSIPGIIDDEISGANAKLIAVAPELLAACKEARLTLAVAAIGDTTCRDIVTKLDAVISKAEGQ